MIYKENKYFHMTPLEIPIRYNHDECSSGKSDALLVTRTLDGWVYKCHRCGESGFKSLTGISPDQVIQFLTNMNKKGKGGKVENVILPYDSTDKLPPKGMVLLLKYEIEWSSKMWYYSPGLNRMILPIYQNKALVGWTGRTLGIPDKNTNPKWYHITQKDWENPHIRFGTASTHVVFVEDPLSGLKVMKSSPSICLMGAYLNPKLIQRGICNIFWLDNDKTSYMVKSVLHYRSLGYNCRIILSKKDPKDETYESINQKIKEILK